MSIFRIERNPTQRQLRQFGAIGTVLLFVLAWWQKQFPSAALALSILGAVVLGCAVWSPRVLRRPFVWLSAVLFPVGVIVGEVVLAVVYFLVFTPIAIVFRLLRRDVLNRAFDATRATYWQDSPPPPRPESYFRQY